MNVVYIGVDQRFWKNIKNEYKDLYSKTQNCQFIDIDISKGSIDQIITNVLKTKAHVIYVDYSHNPEQMIELARVLTEVMRFQNVAVIGLYSHKEEKIIHKLGLASGKNLKLLKVGNDLHDPVYDGLSIALSEVVIEPSFFKLENRDGIEIKIKDNVKVVSVTPDFLDIETNYPLKVNEEIELITYIPPDNLPSNRYTVLEVSERNHYYDYLYRVKLGFLYIDKINIPAKVEAAQLAELKEKQAQREKDLVEVKNKFSTWVASLDFTQAPKNVKLLFIDHELTVIRDHKGPLGELPYVVRLQTNYQNLDQEILRFGPTIIAYQFQEAPEELAEGDKIENYNCLEGLKALVKAFGAIADYQPFVVVFNYSCAGSQKLQTELGYPKILANPGPLNFNLVISLANTYENKHKFFNPQTIKEDQCFIKEDNELSNAHLNFPAKMMSLSECVIEFMSIPQMDLYTSYSIESPVSFSIYLIPLKESHPNASTKGYYRGLVHSISIENKQKVRQHIISKAKKTGS